MQVINIKTTKVKGVVYCGRPSPLGNPFSLKNFSREESIAHYREWLHRQLIRGNQEVIKALEALQEDSILGCYCKPLDCHCDVIIKAWKWWKEKS